MNAPPPAVDRIELMRLFLRIAETGSLSAAAKALGLSQSTSSRQLKRLEVLVGVQLIKRSTHDMTITSEGRSFLPIAQQMVASWDTAVDEAGTWRSENRGPIRIAVPVAAGQTALAKIASAFLLANPGISLDWRLTDEPGDLAANGYDLWIKSGPVLDQALIVHELVWTERTVVGVAEEFAIGHVTELRDKRAVQLVPFMKARLPLSTDAGEHLAVPLRPRFVTDNLFAALAAVRAGVGFSVLPRWAVADSLSDGALIELCPEWKPLGMMLHIAYPQVQHRPARVRSFIAFLRSAAAEHNLQHPGGRSEGR